MEDINDHFFFYTQTVEIRVVKRQETLLGDLRGQIGRYEEENRSLRVNDGDKKRCVKQEIRIFVSNPSPLF